MLSFFFLNMTPILTTIFSLTVKFTLLSDQDEAATVSEIKGQQK